METAMLEIRVGNRYATLVDQDEADLHMMPAELVVWFAQWYDPSKFQTLRVYTPTIINYIGEAIDDGRMSREDVTILATVEASFTFNKEGVLESSWPFGLFNY